MADANQTNGASPETAKVLLYDTENSPNIIAAWGVHEQDALEIVRHRQIITVSWKWLGEKGKPRVVSLPDFPEYKRNPASNLELIRHLHGLMSKADIVIGHNAAEFDDKRVNTEFIKHNLTPPPPHKVVDTLKVARTYFGFNFNSLKGLAEFLGLPHKLETGGYRLWKGCADGDMKAWAKMSRYCAGDVVTLEALYMKFRPWMRRHPALKPRQDGNQNPACPHCDERRLQSRGFTVTRRGRIPKVQCGSCGHWPPLEWRMKSWRLK